LPYYARVVNLPRSILASLGLSLLLALALCAVPLVAVWSIESALVLGVLQPVLCAYGSADLTRRYLQAARADALSLTPEVPVPSLSGLFARTGGFAAALWAIPVIVLGLDVLRVRNCSPLESFASMLLGPGFGIALACALGTGLALFAPQRWRFAPLWAASIPVASALWAVYRMYAGPAIYAYGHFFGFFPGTLYDENVTLTQSFLWLRVASALLALSCVLLTVGSLEPGTLKPAWVRERLALRWLGALGLGLVGLATGYSDELGWSSSTTRVQRALGAQIEGRRCHMVVPREWAQAERQRLAAECDFRVERAEHWLGLTHPGRIDVYLFRSPDEKYRLMGADATNLAKPWRSEIYISQLGWPNPVLGHELVHVVARGAGRGPLRIAGRLGGLWPNPALIEGVAMAAAFTPTAGLTLHEWAHAMLELEMVPPLSQLFGPGFFGQQERLAYTLSGSLLDFVRQRWGAAAVRQTYSTGDLALGVGAPLAEIDAAWRAHLKAQPLSARARDLARARFSGRGVLSAVCPRVLAKLRQNVRVDLSAGDDAGARTDCQALLDIEPHDPAARATLAAVLTRLGAEDQAQRELSQLLESGAPAPFAVAARQAVADQALRLGDYARALTLYEALLQEPLEDDQLRTLQVKVLASRAATSPGTGRRQAQLLFELLVGQPGEHTDPATAVHLTHELQKLRDDGLAQYLEARQLFGQKSFALAADLLAQANARGLPSSHLRAESLRLEVKSRLALGQSSDAPAQLELAAARARQLQDTGTQAERTEAEDFLQYVAFLQGRLTH